MEEKIKHLRKLLNGSEEFQDTMNYFFNILVPDPVFQEKSNFSEADPMGSIIKEAGKKFLQKENIEQLAMLPQQLEEYNFYHGFVSLENYKGVYFYFKGIGGMISLNGGQDGMVHYARLTQLPSHMITPKKGQRFEA